MKNGTLQFTSLNLWRRDKFWNLVTFLWKLLSPSPNYYFLLTYEYILNISLHFIVGWAGFDDYELLLDQENCTIRPPEATPRPPTEGNIFNMYYVSFLKSSHVKTNAWQKLFFMSRFLKWHTVLIIKGWISQTAWSKNALIYSCVGKLN